jgi:hypothetical protein
MADAQKPKVAVHPLLANLKPGESVVELSGYIGQAGAPGKIRLYHSLHDLSHYLEFDENSVVLSAPAAEDIAPNNGLTVWVQSSAPIRWTRQYKTASNLMNTVVNMGLSGASQ